MGRLAIIGGSGLATLPGLAISHQEEIGTPFGPPSAPLTFGRLADAELVFLPRHGNRHTIPPHRINYRANLWALKEIGVRDIVALAAVGGIRHDMVPGTLVIPDQIIDYTYGRRHTIFEREPDSGPHLQPLIGDEPSPDALAGGNLALTHVDFTEPYCARMRGALIQAVQACAEPVVTEGTYGATQGPRLETAAEIRRLERDGCDVVGMTGMPEASLARELGLCYGCCAFVVNWAAGKSAGPISMGDIGRNLEAASAKVARLLVQLTQDCSLKRSD